MLNTAFFDVPETVSIISQSVAECLIIVELSPNCQYETYGMEWNGNYHQRSV